MDSSILTVTAISAISGVAGTAGGGMLSMLVNYRKGRTLSNCMQFAAGVMLSIVAFDLLPEAFRILSPLGTLLTTTAGAVVMLLISAAFGEEEHGGQVPIKRRLERIGVSVVIGMATHDLVEGIAIGTGFLISKSLGFSLAVAIFLHNIPEGIAMASPFLASGMKPWRTIGIVALSGVPMIIGAFLGALIGGISQGVIAACLAAAGGTMIFISLGDILPSAHRLYDGKGIASVAGMLAGALIVLYL